MVDYRLGRLEGIETRDSHKFLVTQEGNTIILYTLWDIPGIRRHAEVARDNHLNSDIILGGGSCLILREDLRLYGGSTQYGPIPNDAARGFLPLLKQYLAERGRNITSLTTEMDSFSDLEKNKAEKWRRLGFDVKIGWQPQLAF